VHGQRRKHGERLSSDQKHGSSVSSLQGERQMIDWIEATWTGTLVPEQGENLDDDSVERVFEVVSDELARLGYVDVVVSGSIGERTVHLVAALDTTAGYPELDAAIRSAFHTAGVVTANWQGGQHEPTGPATPWSARLSVRLTDELV
jgi:hypothetical protein